jgi:drug/metabolite transporter (DMT)-like permease
MCVEPSPTRGYLCVMAAALMWASSGTAGKALFATGIVPIDLIQIRVTLSALSIFFIFCALFRHLLKIRVKDLMYFILLGSGVMALCQTSYFFAISKIQVAVAILLQYLAPSLIALFSICFWKEKITAFKLIALVLSLAGCYLVVGGYNQSLLDMSKTGIAWGLVSAVAFALYSLLGEKGMHRYQPWTVLFYALTFASVTLNIAHSPFHFLTISFAPKQWAYILYIVVFGTILPFGLYLLGINNIRSTRASITATLEPISAAFMAYLLLGEALEPFQILGGICVITAVVLLQWQKEHDALSPETIRSQKQPS